MNTPEDDPEETLKGINPADLLARGLESAKAATGNPQAWQPPTPEELAALLPQYEIESLLGRGGMGAVYRGKQAALDRAVAIKLLPAELAADAEFMSRFQREARTLARLQHPGIVAVDDFGQTSQGHLYFVMEFVNGTDLARLIHGPGVNSAQALEIIAQVCEALQYAHSQGVIHRDIKPANVLINQEGRAKLADFGLARPTSEETASLTRSNVVMGTPDYMAPEQMTGHADHRADLYALGVMLYEMLTGQTPRGAWAPPSQRVQVDVRLDQVVVRALQQDPALRYQQASEIKTDVDVIRTTPLPKVGKAKIKLAAEAPGQRTTPLPKTKKPVSRFTLAAAIVLPLLALAWWVMSKPETSATTQGTPTASSSILWKPAPMSAELAAEAAANEGWVKPFRWYPSGVGKFTDGAVRLKYRWVEGAQLWLDLRSADQSKVELKLNTDGQAALILWQNGRGDTKKSLLLPRLKDGDEGTLELVVVGKTAYAKINDQALILEELPQPWEGILTIGAADSEKAPAINEVEYAILDGIADPLKSLGWEMTEAPAPSSTPWHKLGFFGGHKDPELIRPDADGWIRTGKENLHVTAAEQPGKRFIAGDTALRFRLLWTKENIGNYASLWFRTETRPTQPDGLVILNLSKDRLVFSERDRQLPLETPGPTLHEVTFSQPFKAGDEALLEVIGIGNTVYARVNGQQAQVTTSNLRPKGWIILGGWGACFKDAEYLHLDGLPDPLKALGWEVTQENAGQAASSVNSTAALKVPIPEWLVKARREGGRLEFLRTPGIPAEFDAFFDLDAIAEFDDFVEIFNSAYCWAALRRNGDLWGTTWSADFKHIRSFGPIKVKSVTRGGCLVAVDGADRVLMFSSSVTSSPGAAGLTRAVGCVSGKDRVEVHLDEEGRSLYSKASRPKLVPPDGFFSNAAFVSASARFFLAVEPGEPLRLWDTETGQMVKTSAVVDEVVEVSGKNDHFMLLRSTGEVIILLPHPHTGEINPPGLSAPTDLGPAIRVRNAGRNLAQRADGSWQSWFDSGSKRPGNPEELLPLIEMAGKAIDMEAGAIELPGKIVKGRYVLAIRPREATAQVPAAEAKKRLVEARVHLKAGDVAEARKITEEALATAQGDLATMADAALILAEAQAPERAMTLAGEFVKQAPAEHPQFATLTELRVKLAPTLKQYQARLDAAAKLVTANDDAGEIRELQAALQLVPDGREAAARLEKNPLHIGRPLPGRRWAGALGHTFVPVDGLPNVLFSTCETRVKDFEQFVKETGHDMSGLEPYGSDKKGTWQKPGFEQTGDHPVVLISRQDAEAFCRWLTEKERKAGRLLPGQVYRLPTDREWSAAMGVLDEPGDFPAERTSPENVFTWPKGSAPPRNAENLNWTHDDFRFTAPVGSGAANSFGIYDLLGNVAEICADPWGIADPNGHDAAATIRGSAYQSGLKVWRYRQDDALAGAVRIGAANLGYRCVLDLKTEEQRATQMRMEEAIASLRALDAAQNRPVREIITVVNDEMVLMDLRRWRHLNEEESRRLAGLPLTRLMFSTSERKGRLEVLKTFPLQVLYIALEVAGDHSRYLLDNVKGLPLTHANIIQHPDVGMALRSLDFLVGAPLRQLDLIGFKNLENIEPLRGMPLEALSFHGSTVRLDLSPVKDAPLRRLSLPRSVSLEQFIDICDWWGAKLVQVESDGSAILSRFFREAALTGQPAKVQEVKEALSKKLADFPAFKGWLDTLSSATKTNIDSSMIVARFIGGDATAFDGQFQAFKDHAYLFWPEGLTLDESNEFAAKIGGHLVTITSKEENDFIIQQMETGAFKKDSTLGLERVGPGRMAWKWVTGEPLEYHNWGPESGAGSDAAVFVQHKGQWLWFHQSKSNLHPFIIEWDTPTPQPPVKK